MLMGIFKLRKPTGMSDKEFYTVWQKESEAAQEGVKAGVIKGIWKAAGNPWVIAVLDLPSGDDVDHALQGLPIWSMGYQQIVEDVQWIPLRPYENWAEDLKTLAAQ